MGFHAGKANKRGYKHHTMGCIRAKETTIQFVKYIHENGDPLESITVLNNFENLTKVINNVYTLKNIPNSGIPFGNLTVKEGNYSWRNTKTGESGTKMKGDK